MAKMNEDIMNNVLEKIDNLNSTIMANKDSSSKIMLYLANKNKELEEKIIVNESAIAGLHKDIDDLIEAENHSYNEIERLNGELKKYEEQLNKYEEKLKALEEQIKDQKTANDKTNKTIESNTKALNKSIDGILSAQKDLKNDIIDSNTELKKVSDKVQEASTSGLGFILVDDTHKLSKFWSFLFKLFHYKQLKKIEEEKEQAEQIRQQKIAEELERKRREEEEKLLEQIAAEQKEKQQNIKKIKDILGSTGKK